MAMNDCPRRETLESLLAEELPEDQRQPVEIHVEGCPECQETLGRLTDDVELDTLINLRAGSAAEETVPEETFLRKLAQRPPGETLVHQGAPGSDGPDSIPLEPPTEQGPLGRLDHYHFIEELGRGGMGIVFKALDDRLNRLAAVKVLAAGVDDRARFAREARAAAAVEDDHVVAIHHVEVDCLTPYLVMEYVQGESLKTHET